MSIHYRSDDVLVWHGDCIDLMRELDDGCMDAVVTDPPYGLGFMGAKWDTYANESGRRKSVRHKFDHVGGNHNPVNSADQARTRRVEDHRFQAWCEEWAAECLRLLKPGGHLLAFGGTRTFHRLAAGIEDAGFEIRDSVAWLYGSGFPKSLDVSKAIDRMAGAERDDARHPGFTPFGAGTPRCLTCGKSKGSQLGNCRCVDDKSAPATADAARWNGWGTALKPAFEPIVVARKPLTGTVAANVLTYGTGALNIDGSRIGHASPDDLATSQAKNPGRDDVVTSGVYGAGRPQQSVNVSGRWPANVVLDASQAAALDAQSGVQKDGVATNRNRTVGAHSGNRIYSERAIGTTEDQGFGGSGGASRFFYVAKASRRERPKVEGSDHHPTVKPLTLMRHLVKLVTPPGGTVLDPFGGSGTTAEACLMEGFRCMVMEREVDYLPLIVHRIERAGQTT